MRHPDWSTVHPAVAAVTLTLKSFKTSHRLLDHTVDIAATDSSLKHSKYINTSIITAPSDVYCLKWNIYLQASIMDAVCKLECRFFNMTWLSAKSHLTPGWKRSPNLCAHKSNPDLNRTWKLTPDQFWTLICTVGRIPAESAGFIAETMIPSS